MSSDPCPPIGDTLLNVLHGIIFTSCTFSIIGSLTIIYSFVHWKDVRSPLRQLLVYLSFFDMLVALGNLSGVLYTRSSLFTSGYPLFCQIQSFITTGSSIASFLWTMFIAIYLYLVISKRHSLALKMIPFFVLLSIGLPLVIMSLAMSFGALGLSDYSGHLGWCWVEDPNFIVWPNFENKQYTLYFWEFVAGKGIEIFTYIFTPIVYSLSKCELNAQNYDLRIMSSTSVRVTLQDTDRKLVLIPIIFVGFRLWGSLRYAASILSFTDLYCSPILSGLQALGDSAQGWANCILFCFFTRKIRKKFLDSFSSTCRPPPVMPSASTASSTPLTLSTPFPPPGTSTVLNDASDSTENFGRIHFVPNNLEKST